MLLQAKHFVHRIAIALKSCTNTVDKQKAAVPWHTAQGAWGNSKDHIVSQTSRAMNLLGDRMSVPKTSIPLLPSQ